MDALPVKQGKLREIRRLYDPANQCYRALKAAKADSFEALLTVILQQKLDEKTRLKWAEFNILALETNALTTRVRASATHTHN